MIRNAAAVTAALWVAGGALGCAMVPVETITPYKMVPAADFSSAPPATGLAPDLIGPAASAAEEDWTARWLAGPVSAIATQDEFDRYLRLGGKLEREEFIRLFWERRDPELDAQHNESLQEFSRRVAVANALFGTAHEPGWKSVFGRTLLTLGFPTVIRVGDKDGPRASATVAVAAKSGDRVFWQYGLAPEDLGGTSLATVAAMSPAGNMRRYIQSSSAYFVTFGFFRSRWSMRCGDGWLASDLAGSWGGVRDTTSGTGYNQQGPSVNAGVGEAESPNVAGSGGVYMGRGGGGGGAPTVRRPSVFGAGCATLFRDARDRWLFNTVYYP